MLKARTAQKKAAKYCAREILLLHRLYRKQEELAEKWLSEAELIVGHAILSANNARKAVRRQHQTAPGPGI